MKRLRRITAAITMFALPGVVLAQARVFENPLTQRAESLGLASIIGRVVKAILGASGFVAAIVIILAGLRIIFSQGSEDAIAQGKRALLWAVLGLVVGFGGYMIIDLVIDSLERFI